MTFAQHAARSVDDARILVELDIGAHNVQFVNHGAGLWAVNTDNLYSWVDATLLGGFTAQGFGAIGSVQVDGVLQTDAVSMAVLATLTESYWYDDAGTLWVHLVNHDAPQFHNISIGVIYGYSFDDFTPVGYDQAYEGRLIGTPVIAKRRDPLYFGKLAFGGGSITLLNGDGALDSWAEDNDIYGNQVRVYLGYAALDISEYERLYTGYIANVSVGEETLTVQVADSRKQLTKPIQYTCTALNALDAIVEILSEAYSVSYSATFFDTTAWALAQASVETVTINMQEEAPAIDVIEGICRSVFGVFFVDAGGLYSFRRIVTTGSSQTTIKRVDIMNPNVIDYDPSEVISSAKVGYARDWVTSGNGYTYITNTAYEQSVYNTYKTYNQRTFNTYLDTVTAATAFGETIMQYSKDVHGQFETRTPMTYYARDIGELVDAEVWRARRAMLGTVQSEILSVQYNLAQPSITFGQRMV